MSSADESAIPAFKKRKLQRACDCCRRKKVKCDGAQMPNNRCSRCTARRTECTYLQGHNRNYPQSYVEDLESRLERMEKLMSKFCPDRDVAKEIDAQESDNDTALVLSPTFESSHAGASHVSPLIPPSILAITPQTPAGSPDNHPHSDDEEGDIDREITEGMRRLSVNSQTFRYHGRSSGMLFIRSAIALKNECTGSRPAPQGDRQHPWVTALVEDDFPVFEESSFPPRDLVDALVDLYFRHMNCHYPLLHAPTFKKSIEAGQHIRDGGFGATVLLVCAIGSRFTRDPRVLLHDSTHPHSAGWKWFRHVERARRLSFAPAKLHDLQVYALMTMFLDGTTVPQATWAVVGAGVRAALEVGVHRKKMYAPTPNVEEELWRRAFWTLVLLEWTAGHAFGRPCSIHDEDFDLALPTECDDEYWLTSDGEPLFKQPPGKPSKVSGFVYFLRLGQILAFANRTIYATNKSRAQLGHSDQQWEQRIVAELDSALNKWADSLPSHLRWNPEQENELFLTQAATLATWYHGHQIAVHRSFVSSSRRGSPISFPSAIICTNAARASIQVGEILYKRTGSLTHRNTGMIFMCASVLMMNVLGLKRSGRTVNMEKDLTLVGRTAEMLRSSRYETHYADSLADILCDLMSNITEPLQVPPGASTSANIQHPAADKAETGHPLSSIAIPHERPPPKQGGPDTSRQQTTSDVNGAGAGPSFASLTFAHSGATLDLPPSDTTSSFTPAFGSDGLRPPAQGLLPVNGSIHRSPAGQAPPPPVFPHAGGYRFLPLPPYGPLQPQPRPRPRSDASARPNPGAGQSRFDVGGGRMFGLHPFDYDPPKPSPFVPSAAQAGAGDNIHARAGPSFADAAMDSLAAGPGGDRADISIPDFMLMDDTLTMWSSMPPTSGWDDWGASFTNANNAGT